MGAMVSHSVEPDETFATRLERRWPHQRVLLFEPMVFAAPAYPPVPETVVEPAEADEQIDSCDSPEADEPPSTAHLACV